MEITKEKMIAAVKTATAVKLIISEGKQIVFINEQHSILEDQDKLMDANRTIIKVPASGWTLDKMLEINSSLENLLIDSKKLYKAKVLFISPIPALMLKLGALAGFLDYKNNNITDCSTLEVQVMHNDRREKKELPGGKVISVTASTGWVLADA